MPYSYVPANNVHGVPDPVGLADGTLAVASDGQWAAAEYACIDAGADTLALRLRGDSTIEVKIPALYVVSTAVAGEGISPTAMIGLCTVEDDQEVLRGYVAANADGSLLLSAIADGNIVFEMQGIGAIARFLASTGLVIGSASWMNDHDPDEGGLALEGTLQPTGGIDAGDLPESDPEDGVSVWVDTENGNVLKRASTPE